MSRRRRGSTRPRIRTWVLAGGVAAAAVGVAVTAGPASADPPVRTAWWNAAAGSGQAVPDPDTPATTPAGGLHVSMAPGKVAAYGAVAYALPAGDAATLQLTFTTPSTTNNKAGAPPLQACPTKTTTWKAGDDQPMDAAPGYDCDTVHYVGIVSSDGTTETFFVDGGAERQPGLLSLAVVPVTTTQIPELGTDAPADTTQPFSVDFAKPGPESFVVTSSTMAAPPPPPPPPPPATAGAAGTSTPGGATAGGGSTTASAGTARSGSAGTAGIPAPPMLTGSGAGAVPSTDAGAPPVVAGQPGAASGTAAPVAATAPAPNSTGHDVAIALLILLAVAVLGSANQQRWPRGLVPTGVPTEGSPPGVPSAPGATTAAMTAPVLSVFGSRGLGRFTKPRNTPPRPLT